MAVLATGIPGCSDARDTADPETARSAGIPSDDASASASNAALRPGDPEARGWVAPGDGRVSLGPGWFDSVTDASQFIDRLYAAGAERVVIASESIREESDGFRRADAIRVQLPLDPAARARVLAVLDAESRASGRGPVADRGQAVHEISWAESDR